MAKAVFTDNNKIYYLDGGVGEEEFTIGGYNDGNLCFKGRLFSEGSFFDEEHRSITSLRLFAVGASRFVYSVASGSGSHKERRAYVLNVQGEMCDIDNGINNICLPLEMLFSAVFGLCGVNSAQDEFGLKATMEECLRAVGV